VLTIDVGGSLAVGERIDAQRIEIGGRIAAKRIKATETFRIGKRGNVQGLVEARSILVRERARADSLYGDEIRVEERGRVKSVYGRTVYLEREVTVEGEILYTESYQAEDRVVLRSEPKKVDTLPPPDQLQ